MDEKMVREVVLRTMQAQLELQLRAVRQLLDEEDVAPNPPRRKGRRKQSIVDLCMEVLTATQEPMHVNELVDELRGRFGRVTDRDTISSALGKKAKAGILVRQTAPATFAVRAEKDRS